MTALIGVFLLFFFLALGMPVALAMLVAGMLGLLMILDVGGIGDLMAGTFYETTASYVLLTVPMFILMSEYMAASGIARDVIRAADKWAGRLPGGLGIACVLASSLLAAVVGSSTASAATMSTAAYPNMKELGYKPGFAVGIIAIAGTLSIMIPPSVILIIYGILTEQSIGRLLIAGLIPGLLTAAGYVAVIVAYAIKNPQAAPRAEHFDFKGAVRSLGTIWPVMLLMAIVIFSLYGGLATTTEIGAIGAAGALLIVFLLGRFGLTGLFLSGRNTLRTVVMIFAILIGAHVFGYFMAYSEATQQSIELIMNSGLSPWAVLLIIVAVYLILGMFLDQIAILVLTVPLTFPIVMALGFDPIWYGIIITKTVEIGLVSPPMGLNVFISSNITRVPLSESFKGVAPFLAIEFVILGALLAFPAISTFLPSMM